MQQAPSRGPEHDFDDAHLGLVDRDFQDSPLSDPDLVWHILQNLLAASGDIAWDFQKYHRLSKVSKVFKSALNSQPVHINLGSLWLEESRAKMFEETKLHIVKLVLHPRDVRATRAVLSNTFKSTHAARLEALHNLILNRTLGMQLMAPLCHFTSLRTLELSSGEADWEFPYRLSVHFQSSWVQSLAKLATLVLKGYLLRELDMLPESLKNLDLSDCRVSYDTAVVLPQRLKLQHLAVPSSGGRFRWIRADEE